MYEVKSGGQLLIHWYGTATNTMLGAWKPGYVQQTLGKHYYKTIKLHPKHQEFTNEESECKLYADRHVIGKPFQLTETLRLPTAVLRAAAADAVVQFSLPAHLAE